MAKLGPHIQNVTAASLEWASRAPVVKAIDTTAPFHNARPDAIRVWRHYWANGQDLYRPPGEVANDILSALGSYRHPLLHCEVYNEISRGMTEPYARLLDSLVPILHAAGVYVAAPCWATGDYEQEDWDTMRRHGWCDLDAVALHAYWADKGPTIWNGLRWRRYWKPGDPRVLVTECGRDVVRDGDNGEYIGQGGWIKDGISAQQYVAELVTYDAELVADPYVLGATVFTSGGEGGRWDKYETDGISGQLPGAEGSSVAPPPTDEEDHETMKLSEQYPNEYAAWVAAGGVDNNFRSHLIGVGALPATKDNLVHLLNEEQAKLNQIRGIVDRLPLA